MVVVAVDEDPGVLAFEELIELILASADPVGADAGLRKALQAGALLLRGKVDRGPAGPTRYTFVGYEPTDCLLGLIAALKAGDADLYEVAKGYLGH